MATPLEERIRRVSQEEITIVPYDPGWPEAFRQEREHLLTCLPKELIRRIEHYGSTAVPGLSAKPVVDVMVEVTDLQATKARIVPILECQGYDYFWRPTSGHDTPPFYAWFIKRNAKGIRTHHLHMVEGTATFRQHWEALCFRDYLLARPEVAAEYAALKTRLAAQHPRDREAYTQGKTQFIAQVMERIRLSP